MHEPQSSKQMLMLNTGASVINIMHTCMFGVAESNWLERKQPIHIPCPSYMFSKGATLAQFLLM